MDSQAIKERANQVKMQFDALNAKVIEAQQFVANATQSLLILKGRFEALNDLLPNDEKLTEGDQDQDKPNTEG